MNKELEEILVWVTTTLIMITPLLVLGLFVCGPIYLVKKHMGRKKNK